MGYIKLISVVRCNLTWSAAVIAKNVITPNDGRRLSDAHSRNFCPEKSATKV